MRKTKKKKMQKYLNSISHTTTRISKIKKNFVSLNEPRTIMKISIQKDKYDVLFACFFLLPPRKNTINVLKTYIETKI